MNSLVPTCVLRARFVIPALVCLLALSSFGKAQDRTSEHVEGLNESRANVYALSGATLHVSPDKSIENGTLLIRGQKIVAAGGPDLAIPDGARQIDVSGRHIYAGWIDSYVPVDLKLTENQGTTYWNAKVIPQLNVAKQFSRDDLESESFRKAGFTSALVVPKNGIVKGTSSMILLADQPEEQIILNPVVAQHMQLTVARGFGGGYPSSPMGAVALARQTMHDARWYERAHRISKSDSDSELPETNASLEALGDVINADMPVMIDTSNELFVLRADRFAREFGLKLMIKGSGNEYRRLKEIAALGKPIVLPLKYPTAPDVSDPTSALDVSLETLMHWDHAPENPGRLAQAGVTMAFTADGLDGPDELLEHVQIAVTRGLSPSTALASLTTEPAKLFGVDDQVGTLEAGKLGNIVIMDQSMFEPKSKVLETWVAGKRHRFDRNALREMSGQWKLNCEIELLANRELAISGDKTLSAKILLPNEGDEEKSVKIKNLSRSGARLSGTFPGEELGESGVHRFSLLLVDNDTAHGQLVSSKGAVIPLSATKTGPAKSSDKTGKDGTQETKATSGHSHSSKMASFPVNYPLGSFGRCKQPEVQNNTLITNVTVWTNSDRGILANGSVLIDDGKIAGVYSGEDILPTVERVIDGTGMHLTAGIIDCHSHMATDSGVNEGSQAVTAEVRIGDMVDCDDINIYRQLAGGVTCVNILHGSANPIGGQNQVIKLRWGANDEEMKFPEAPQGIKFALGENVKRSRSPESTRYPKTRMGVEQIMEDRFRAAEEYSARWKRYTANPQGLPPRIDLELEALAEIVDGTRWIHCHSYRQDEILALIRVLDAHGITIGSFQHILEGYKVADAMAKHGAMASSFSDWWAYKFEVYDATPYGGAIMHNAGIVVSFNSDDRELARHLNHEAAKAVKYGGVPEEEALKFVTLNPARQLRIDQYVGSIEVGKHADLALWSGPPLSPTSRCEKTWVDGVKQFDLEQSLFDSDAFASMRNELVQKILASGQEMKPLGKEDMDPADLWPRFDEFCHEHDGHGHDE